MDLNLEFQFPVSKISKQIAKTIQPINWTTTILSYFYINEELVTLG